MKWLKSTTNKRWTVAGKTIPPYGEMGKYLKVNEDVYTAMISSSVFKSLISNGAVLVLDTEPAELRNNVEGLKSSNAALMEKITSLKEQLDEAKKQLEEAKKQEGKQVDIEAIKKEAVKELQEEAVKELQELQDQLDKANAENKTLKAELKKAKKEGQ